MVYSSFGGESEVPWCFSGLPTQENNHTNTPTNKQTHTQLDKETNQNRQTINLVLPLRRLLLPPLILLILSITTNYYYDYF